MKTSDIPPPQYGLRKSRIKAQSTGTKYTIYNGGISDNNEYKDVCNGSGGIAIANSGPAKDNRYESITSGNGCPPVAEPQPPKQP